MLKGPQPPRQKRRYGSNWVSVRAILFFLFLTVAGLLLASAGTTPGFDVLFGFGLVLWVVGLFGALYGIVYRYAGPKAAKFAVLVLSLILLGELFSGKRDEKHQDLFDRSP